MIAKNKQDNILGFLQCAGILEERAYVLYKELAGRVDLPLVNSLLLHIAYDSQKHSAIFRGIGESIAKPRKKLKNCGKKLGGIWTMVDGLASEIAREKRETKEQLPSLIKKLTALESAMAEEYYILVQVKTLQFMTKGVRELYDVDLEDLAEILETIIRDEGVHRELLSKMKKILVGEREQTDEKAPMVRYRNLDAWSRAMPDTVYESLP